MTRRTGKRLLGLGAALLVSLLPAWPSMAAMSLRIGSIGVDAGREIEKLLPLAQYLAAQMRDDGVDGCEVVVARDIRGMAALLTARKADLYIDSPYPVAAVSRLAGSQFLVRRWKKGMPDYRSVVFAREAGGFRSLRQLAGKVIALEEPYSTSGYFLPKLALLEGGLRPVPRSEGRDLVQADEVGYVLTYNDRNTVHWVVRGRVAAGATDLPTYRKQAAASPERLIVLHESPAVPRQVVSYRSDLPPALVARVRQVLLEMDSSEEGRSALRATEKTTKFDELPPDSMRPFLRAHSLIDAELGHR